MDYLYLYKLNKIHELYKIKGFLFAFLKDPAGAAFIKVVATPGGSGSTKLITIYVGHIPLQHAKS